MPALYRIDRSRRWQPQDPFFAWWDGGRTRPKPRLAATEANGRVLVFDSSGVMVELYNNVALRRCQITRAEA